MAILIMAGLTTLLCVGVFVAAIVVWVNTWPSFGMALLAAPAGLLTVAFGSIAIASFHCACCDDEAARMPTGSADRR